MTIAIYPGSFDPITNGHLDIAVRASKLFEKLIIGIYDTPSEKVLLFSTRERVKAGRRSGYAMCPISKLCPIPN